MVLNIIFLDNYLTHEKICYKLQFVAWTRLVILIGWTT
jgi:hypothetical protein